MKREHTGGDIKKEKWTPDSNFLSIIFGPDAAVKESMETGEKEKISLFETGLENGLKKDDTIEKAVKKIVKTAIAAEFGPALARDKAAEGMISSITQGILSDNTLRKQALVIIDRFTKAGTD